MSFRIPLAVLAFSLCVIQLQAAQAQTGEWQQVALSDAETFFVSVSVTDPQHMYVFGTRLDFDLGSLSGVITPRVFRSEDGAATFSNITGNLEPLRIGLDFEGDLTGGAGLQIQFLNNTQGFLLWFDKIYRTNDTGTTWTPIEFETGVLAMHFFDTQRGIVTTPGQVRKTSDGGATWRTIQIPSNFPMEDMFWANDNVGFIMGNDFSDEDQDFGPRDGALLRTTDAGESWTVVEEFELFDLGPMFFLPDGNTGWIAATEYIDQHDTRVWLFKTDNGGEDLTNMDFPAQVGTFGLGAFSRPINLGNVAAMYWENPNYGHLVGSAFVTRISSGSGETSVFRTASFSTRNGGNSWQKTDLGEIQLNLQGMMIEDDRGTGPGMFQHYFEGYIGGVGSVWRLEHSCTSTNQCIPDYTCEVDSCTPMRGGTDPDGSGNNNGGDSDSSGNGSADGGNPGGDSDTGSGNGGDGSSGCGAGAPIGAALLGLWALLGWRRRDAPEAP